MDNKGGIPLGGPVEGLIPHRKPMLMIDALREATPEGGVAEKTFGPGDYGVYGNKVCETALVECVAQTSAALSGYEKLSSGGEPRMGFLAGLTSFRFVRRPRVGEPLLIEARYVRGFGDIFIVKGRVFAGEVGGECVAERENKIYLINRND